MTLQAALLAFLLATATMTLPGAAAARRFTRAADAVRLDGIRALTFQAGRDTSARRVRAMPQLNCVGGSGCKHYAPETIRCTNSGASYSAADVEWTCKADLPPEFKLGATEVVCEGYDSADDDFVLKGSCALEYRLLLTDAGLERFGGGWGWGTGSSASSSAAGDSGLVAGLFWLVFGAVVLFIGYSLVRECLNNGARLGGAPPRPGFGGFGGGGGGDDDDPPPPYDPRPPKAYGTRRTQSSGWGWGQSRSRNQAQGWQPGFWTGAATGAAAGYFAGNRGGGSGSRQQMRERANDAGLGSSTRPFGGGGGTSFSSTRYESTGFGGTRRR